MIANQMIKNWFEILMDFDFEIQHIPGMLNILPDRLSRLYDLGLRKERFMRVIDDSNGSSVGRENLRAIPKEDSKSSK